jgi:type III secretion system FlhB-like substrate exporter
MIALFTLIMGKARRTRREKSAKLAARQDKINHGGATIEPDDEVGINHLPEPAETKETSSGRDAVANRLRDLVKAHGMDVKANADLRELLAALRIGDPIPIPAFAVVAEVLFSILQANQHHQADGESTS